MRKVWYITDMNYDDSIKQLRENIALISDVVRILAAYETGTFKAKDRLTLARTHTHDVVCTKSRGRKLNIGVQKHFQQLVTWGSPVDVFGGVNELRSRNIAAHVL